MNEQSSSQPAESMLSDAPADGYTSPAHEQATATPAQRVPRWRARAWWRAAWAMRLALVGIVLLGAYFRFLSLTDWDSGTLLHPDERFLTDVTSSIRLPASASEYFDAARSPTNPRNVGKGFYVYGTFPVVLTRAVAVMLTPEEMLPETVPARSDPQAPGELPGTEVPNPERAFPTLTLLQQLVNPDGLNLTGYGQVQKVGRVVVTLFDLGSIVLVFLIGARLYGRRVGLLAALLAALAVMSIQQSHFYVDPIFSTFFALLALYWAVRVAQGGGIWCYVALGLSIGGAMASRITLAALGLIAIVAAVQAALIWWQGARAAAMREAEATGDEDGIASAGVRLPSFWDHLLTRTLPLLVLAGMITLVTFRVLHPYAFVGSTASSPALFSSAGEATIDSSLYGMGFLDVRPSPRFLENMATIQSQVTGEGDIPPSQQWVNRTAYWFPWKNMVVWGMGPALGVVAWLGWAVAGWWLLRRLPDVVRGTVAARALAPLVPWVWVGFYFAWQGRQFASTMRYMLPIYGALIIFGAWLLVALWQRAQQRGPYIARRRWRTAALAATMRWLPLVVVLLTFAWAYAFTRIYTRPHPRVMAAEWMVQHAPHGSFIAAEIWDDPLPLQVAGWNPWGTIYRGVDTAPYAEDEPQKYFGIGTNPGLLDQLEAADYITLTSNRIYDSTARLPMRYPVLRRYYYYLFTGDLGFDLAAEVTSYPTFLGVPIPDQGAEEAFTVYDHPRVLIFQKNEDRFSRDHAEALLTEHANWSEVYKLPVGVADRVPTALRLTESEWPTYRAGGTWAARWNPASIINSDAVAPLVWLLVLEVVGLATFALLFHLLPWLPDRGFSLARALGLLVVAYVAWLLGSLHALPFTPLTVWLCALPLLLGGAWVAWRSRGALRAFGHERRRALLTAQGLYLLAYVAWLVVRWFNPDLWHPALGGEKPMDLAYLNAVLQSSAFPPYDPWFAGGYINYYYFGFVIVGTLVHLTTIVPEVAYNLAVPTLFALTALGAWGIVYNLLAPRRLPRLARSTDDTLPAGVAQRWLRAESRARLSALLAPIFVVLLGSLTQAIWFLNGYAAENVHRPEWAFWDATRIVAGTVNEFPFFTFLFADLHAHMIVMPFSLAVLGLLVALVRRDVGRRVPLLVLLLLGLLAGTLRATNTWDYPTYLGLTVVTLVLLAWWRFRHTRRYLPADTSKLERRLLAGRRVLLTVGQIVLVVGVGNLLFLPFTSHFATESSGVALWIEGRSQGMLAQVIDAQRTTLSELLRMYGLWLFVLVSAGALLARRVAHVPFARSIIIGLGVLALVGLLVGLSAPWLLVPLVLAAGVLALSVSHRAPRLLMPLLLAGTALAIVLGVEFIVVRGDVGRMNTVFKFGLHAWTLFALASAVALPWVWRNLGTRRKSTADAEQSAATRPGAALPGWLWRGAAVLLVVASLVYPLTATPARIANRYAPDLPHTLDGAAFMQHVSASEAGQSFPLSEDDQAIAWMQQNIDGTPIILEAHLPSYRWAGRVATYTGLPTLLGWEWHQIQQRTAAHTAPIVSNRQQAIQQIYEGADPWQALDLIYLYGIEYIYVGGVERAIYHDAGLAKFDTLVQDGALEVAYSVGDTHLYRVVAPGSPTVLTSDFALVPPTARTPPPLMLDQPVDELPVVGEYAWNTWASSNSWAALLLWLVALYVLALAGLPLAVLVFGGWRDSGAVWARLLGLLLLGYAVWLPVSLELWHYDMWGVLGGALLVLAANVVLLYILGWRAQPVRVPRQHSDVQGRRVRRYRGTVAGSKPRLSGIVSGERLKLRALHNSGPDSSLPPESATLPPLRPTLVAGGAHIAASLKARWRGALLVEGLFLAGFLLLVLVRMLNPDLWHPVWGGEKPMEFGFLNAMLRSPVMPPYDPFFSGGYTNYYYYGLYLVSLPIKVTGIAPALAFNLVVPTFFALTLAGGYALVAQLTGRVRYGLLGAAFLALLGNLASVVPAGWSRGIMPVIEGLQSVRPAELGAWLGDWYTGPSRVVPNTINEFPFFTFLFADLHPHMLALPVVLLVVGLAYRYAAGAAELYTRPGRPLLVVWALLAALALGTLAATNSWDFPTYALLLGAVLVGTAWRSGRGVPVSWLWIVQAMLLAVGIALGGMMLYAPFFDSFYAMVAGVGLVRNGTAVGEYLLLYGLFLAIVLPVVLGIGWRLLAISGRKLSPQVARLLPLVVCIGLPVVLIVLALVLPVLALKAWLVALLVLCGLILLARRLSVAVWFTLLLALLAWAVSLGVELVFVRDHLVGSEAYRMNTVFKFGLHVWTLLALAAAASLPVLLRGMARMGRRAGGGEGVPRLATLGALGVLVAAAAVFPVVGTLSRVENRFAVDTGPTLDGLAFLREASFTYDCEAFGTGCTPGMGMLQIDLAPDAAGIGWLNEHIAGTPVVAQSDLWFYRAYGIRVAANTGLPTIVSQLHVDEQRDPLLAAQRSRDVTTLFEAIDTETKLRLLARYDVDYIYVGAVERAFYAAAGLQKFDAMVGTYLDVAYDAPGVRIYSVVGVPPGYAQPEPFAFDTEPLLPARPVSSPHTSVTIPAESPPPDVADNAEADAPRQVLSTSTLEEQVAADPTNATLVYGLAKRYQANGRLDDAAAILAVATAANPQDVGLNHLYGDILVQAGRYEEAAEAYRRIAEAVPTAGNWNKLAVGLIEGGNLAAAEEALQQAIAIDASEAEPHFRLGQLYAMQGENEAAVASLEAYLERAPDGYLAPEARSLIENLR